MLATSFDSSFKSTQEYSVRKCVVCPTAEIILSTWQFFPLYLCLSHAPHSYHLLLLVFIVEKLKVWFVTSKRLVI